MLDSTALHAADWALVDMICVLPQNVHALLMERWKASRNCGRFSV